jgi:anti-sigma B factor antagonist
MKENNTAGVHSSSTTIDVHRARVDSSVIRIQGGLLNAATSSIWRTVETEFRQSPRLVALDLSAVTEIDAAGLGVLMAAADRAGELDISFCLVGAHEGAVGTALAQADLIEAFEILPAGIALDGW